MVGWLHSLVHGGSESPRVDQSEARKRLDDGGIIHSFRTIDLEYIQNLLKTFKTV